MLSYKRLNVPVSSRMLSYNVDIVVDGMLGLLLMML